MKTENEAQVGMHCFEAAGLGKAPFRFAGFYVSTYVACQGAPVQPGTTCDYCGAALMNVCAVKSADGKRFKVGCDCVRKVGDGGLMKAYKRSPEYRAAQREKRRDLANRKREEVRGWMTEPDTREMLASQPHPQGFKDRETDRPLSLLDWMDWMMANSGDAGQARVHSRAKKTLAYLSDHPNYPGS